MLSLRLPPNENEERVCPVVGYAALACFSVRCSAKSCVMIILSKLTCLGSHSVLAAVAVPPFIGSRRLLGDSCCYVCTLLVCVAAARTLCCTCFMYICTSAPVWEVQQEEVLNVFAAYVIMFVRIFPVASTLVLH